MRILKRMFLLTLFIFKSGIGLTQHTDVHPLPLVERKYCFSESELREIDKVFYLHDLYKTQNERLTKNNAVLKKDIEKEKRKNKNALALNITTILALIVLLL